MRFGLETVVDGLTFRSRLEAGWYVYLKLLGLKPTYEPEPFKLEFCYEQSDRFYLPDFRISTGDLVEIKSENADPQEFLKPYICGYKHPIIIVEGWPLLYFAARIAERHKGNPSGQLVCFDPFQASGRFIADTEYPDEHGTVSKRPSQSGGGRFIDGGDLAREAWNQIRYIHRR